MAFVEPVTLRGAHVVLEPLARAHEAGLKAAAADGELWRLWYTSVPAPDRTLEWIDAALDMRAKLGALPFVVREHVDRRHRRQHTLLQRRRRAPAAGDRPHVVREARPAHRRSTPKRKLLLLTHAFETLDCIAVEFRTSFFNFASREAIARLGAKQDGILRHHQILPDGTLRDTVVFTIVAAEWPAVKRNLVWRLTRPRA